MLRTLDTLKLPPGMKEILWGSHYAETGDFADAAPHYLAATHERGAPPLAWQLLSACQFGLGQRDQAIASIAAGLKANPKDQGLSLLAQQSDLLYAGAQDSRLDPIVTAIVRDPVSGSADLDLLQAIVQAWGSNDSQLLATRLQDFVGSHPDSLNGQVQLMECYETMGRAADAVSVAHKAVNAFPTDLQGVRSAVKICELSRQWSDLSEFAQELKRRSPGDAQEADTALAMADVGQNQPDAAVSALAPYLSAAKANPDQNADFLSLYACATADAGNVQEAADLIWPLAVAEPQWRQRWVGIARGLPDSVQAVAWLDRLAAAMPSGDPDLLASIAEAYNELAAVQHDATLTRKSSRLFATVAASPTASTSSLIMAGLQAESCSDWSRASQLPARPPARSRVLCRRQQPGDVAHPPRRRSARSAAIRPAPFSFSRAWRRFTTPWPPFTRRWATPRPQWPTKPSRLSSIRMPSSGKCAAPVTISMQAIPPRPLALFRTWI